MGEKHVIIEYSLNGGDTWRHGRTVAAWITELGQSEALKGQKRAVCDAVRELHGNVGSIITRVLDEDDPRAEFNQLPSSRRRTERVTQHDIACHVPEDTADKAYLLLGDTEYHFDPSSNESRDAAYNTLAAIRRHCDDLESHLRVIHVAPEHSETWGA